MVLPAVAVAEMAEVLKDEDRAARRAQSRAKARGRGR